MNLKQKVVLWAGGLVLAILCLIPPQGFGEGGGWARRYVELAPFWVGGSIKYGMLILEAIPVILLSGLLLVTLKDKKDANP